MAWFPWLDYIHPQVRDLAFLLVCPPLIQQWPNLHVSTEAAIDLPDARFWQQKFADYRPRLAQLDRHPAPLLRSITVWPEQRLGLYAEDLLAFWLGDVGWHEFALLDRHRVVMDGRRTLGELDFLVENLDDGAIEHWELTVKFYLGHADFRPSHWVGVNATDRLGRKLHHLAHRQFDPARVAGLGVERRRAIIKGRLFWPLDQPSMTGVDRFQWMAPAALVGHWGHRLPAFGRWRAAQRAEWLTPRADAPVSGPWLPPGLLLDDDRDACFVLQPSRPRPPFFDGVNQN